MRDRFVFSLLTAILIPMAANAQSFNHLPDGQEQSTSLKWNSSQAQSPLYREHLSFEILRPFSEMELTGSVAVSGNIVSGAMGRELDNLRWTIAKNLPNPVKMLVYVSSTREEHHWKAKLQPLLGTRLRMIRVPVGKNEIWARDSLPYPVLRSNQAGQSPFALTGSIYPQHFAPNEAFARASQLSLHSTGYYFRGGNLLADADGNCFAEYALELRSMGQQAQNFLQKNFGCKKTFVLPQDGGIGDIDERLKLMPGHLALTDSSSYAKTLRELGYNVIELPRIAAYAETYMNTLLVNGTIFVPQMGLRLDAVANEIYRRLGLQVVPVPTKALADEGNGNIHCLTMNYPPGVF